MRQRAGFVSNSSSASFILDMIKMSDLQIYAMRHREEVAANLNFGETDIMDIADWQINDDDGRFLKGCTDMDNLAMDKFFKAIGLSHDAIAEYNDD